MKWRCSCGGRCGHFERRVPQQVHRRAQAEQSGRDGDEEPDGNGPRLAGRPPENLGQPAERCAHRDPARKGVRRRARGFVPLPFSAVPPRYDATTSRWLRTNSGEPSAITSPAAMQ